MILPSLSLLFSWLLLSRLFLLFFLFFLLCWRILLLYRHRLLLFLGLGWFFYLLFFLIIRNWWLLHWHNFHRWKFFLAIFHWSYWLLYWSRLSLCSLFYSNSLCCETFNIFTLINSLRNLHTSLSKGTIVWPASR